MIRQLCRVFVLSILPVLLLACSSTFLSGSWRSPDFQEKLRNVYIVGVSKNDTSRRIFEDEFRRQLQVEGVNGISSYKDFPLSANADLQALKERVHASRADSVLLTRVLGKRTEEVVNPGRVTTYEGGGLGYGRPNSYGHPYNYAPDPHYRNWGSYYDRRYETIYEPATVSQFQIVTVEANIYDANTDELIWSAQLETMIDANVQQLISDFVRTVVKDLSRQGLL